MSKWKVVYDLHDIPDHKWLPIKIVAFVDCDKCRLAWKWRRMTKKEWDRHEKEQSKGKNNDEKIYETLHINDECYTPDYAVRPLLKYLEKFKGKTIWCPFDTEESEYVKLLQADGHKVIYSHKDDGQNFYDFGDGLFAQDIPDFDLLVSNPPFHNKAQLVEKVINLGKPFALLLPLTWLNDSASYRLFSQGGGGTYDI